MITSKTSLSATLTGIIAFHSYYHSHIKSKDSNNGQLSKNLSYPIITPFSSLSSDIIAVKGCIDQIYHSILYAHCSGLNLPSSIPVSDSYIKKLYDLDSGYQAHIHYDYRSKQPKFVYERFVKFNSKDILHKQNRKGVNFYAAPEITAEHFKVRPKDYIDSKYDRGHMIPAADMTYSPDLFASTFSMMNISPQNPDLNKVYWAKFEAWLRFFCLNGEYQEVEILTGPVFCPHMINDKRIYAFESIGTYPRLIPVPSHFFKVVRMVKYIPLQAEGQSLQQVSIGCFMIPNHNIPAEVPINTFMVKLDELEALSGLRFFESSLSEVERKKLDEYIPELRAMESILRLPHGNTASDTQIIENTYVRNKEIMNQAMIASAVKKKKEDLRYAPMIHLCQTLPCHKQFFPKK